MNLKKFFKSSVIIIPLLLLSINQKALSDDEMWEALKEGGKVILMRHALTEKGKGTGNSLIRDPSCFNEKKLSYKGKNKAEKLGEIFKEKDIPIEKVLYSPFCRTTSTARIVFDKGEPSKFLSLLEILSEDEKELQSEKLSEFISSYKGEGNIILITHEPNIRAISFETVKHLDFIVFEPEGNGDFDELGIVKFEEE